MSLIISGVVDGPLPGGRPKAIELTVLEDIADLSIYAVGSANNGNGGGDEEFEFPAVSATMGDRIYIATEDIDFTAFFGFAPDYTSNAANINGDDAVELFQNGVVIDVFGDINLDGTGQPWEYLDGWAYRKDGTGPDGTAFVLANWVFSTPNALDGEADNGSAETPFPIGSYSAGPAGPTLSVDNVFTAEGDTGFTTLDFTVALSEAVTETVTVDFATVDGTATAFEDYTPVSQTLIFDPGELSKTISIDIVGDMTPEPDEIFSVVLSSPVNAAIADGTGEATIENDDGVAITKIHEIQGTADQNLLDSQVVTVEAVVVGDFQDGDADTGRSLRGFYLQEESADQDADAATSEGIFIFEGGDFITDVQVGDVVRVTGTVDEFFGETQLDTITDITIVNPADGSTDVDALVTRAIIDLPTAATTQTQDGEFQPDLEAYEGMLVGFSDTLTITEMFQLDRFNEIKLTEGDRPQQFTQDNAPDAAGFAAFTQEIGSRTITYDDGLSFQNQPIDNLDGFQGFSAATAPSMGDTIDDLSGVLSYQWAGDASSGATWRVRATEDGENTFDDTNPREEAPADVGSDYKVASLNVLNFFTTLDEFPSVGEGSGPNGLSPRGADTAPQNAAPGVGPLDEYTRQLDKLVTTLIAMDSDVVGLVEIENDFAEGGDAPTGTGTIVGTGVAIQELVNELNDALGDSIYDWVRPAGQTTTTGEFLGGDAIAVGFIYDTTTTALVGASAVLDTEALIDPNDTTDGGRNRGALAQTFEEIESGGQFTASVNHFKSKGDSGLDGNNDGIPDDPTNPDSDQLDGQGYWNDTRTKAAEALVEWLEMDPTGAGDDDIMILGDLNAYAREDPIQALIAAGYTDLAQEFIGDDAYSFVFDGLTGTLDYALASEPLLAQITGTSEWNINSDEADALDYNLEFGRDPSLFDGSTPFRSSDHDPIIVGLDLNAENAAPVAAADRVRTDYDAEKVVDVLANDSDPDGDDLEIVEIAGRQVAPGDVVTLETGAEVELNGDGTLTYDPMGAFAYLAQGERARDTFSYTISDGDLEETADATVVVRGDRDDYNTGDWFLLWKWTNGGFNLFGFNGDDYFISGQGVSGWPKFNDFDDFLVTAADVYGGEIERTGIINDQRLDDGRGPSRIFTNQKDEVTIAGSGIEGRYVVQFDNRHDAERFEAFTEEVLAKIDAKDVVATDPDDFRFDISPEVGPEMRVFFDKEALEFGFTLDSGATQERFDDLELFVEAIAADFGGIQTRDGSFNAERIADGASPNVRVTNDGEVVIVGAGVGGRFVFEFDDTSDADVVADGVRTLFDQIDEANTIAGDPLVFI